MKDEVDFFPADKHKSLLQIYTMLLMGIVKHSQSSPNSKFTMSLQYLKKEVRYEVDFWHVNIKVSCKLISTLWASKMPTKWYYHYCWAWSSTLKVLKVIGLQISLQYIKKEDMKGVRFLHAVEHQSFYKLGLLFLMEMAKFYGGPTMCNVTCFLAQTDCRTFLSEHCNAVIKQQLRG